MEKIIEYGEYALNGLSAEDRKLVEAAFSAADRAFAPFSGFNVGAAAAMEGGEIFTATNQESEVYPCGMCAERVLMYTVKSMAPHEAVRTVAVAANYEGVRTAHHTFPCGSCAQTLIDMEKRQKSKIRIIMAGADSCTVLESVSGLMPFRFKMI